MSYDSQITITLPASLADIASLIGRAMDTDTGGADSFSRDIASYDAEGEAVYADTITCRTVCTSAFRERALAMLNDPAILHYACVVDYGIRWPDHTPPTMQQCVDFVAKATVE